MHLNANQDENPYFPLAVSCIGEKEIKTHGQATKDSVSKTVGNDEACIYRVER